MRRCRTPPPTTTRRSDPRTRPRWSWPSKALRNGPWSLRDTRPPAGALGGVDDATLLTAFLADFREQYQIRERTMAADVLRRYRPLCTTLGRTIRARTISGDEVEGVAEDLDAWGNLLVRSDGAPAT